MAFMLWIRGFTYGVVNLDKMIIQLEVLLSF